MNSRMLERYLMELGYACQDVQDDKMCGDCPLRLTNCLEDTSVIVAAENMNANMFTEFMDYARNCYQPSDEDIEADYADEARKGYRDELVIEQGHGF